MTVDILAIAVVVWFLGLVTGTGLTFERVQLTNEEPPMWMRSLWFSLILHTCLLVETLALVVAMLYLLIRTVI